MDLREKTIKEIQARLERELRINLHSFPVHLRFSDGDLILEGELEHIAAKKLALEIAGSARGIDRIVDRLRIAPAEKMGDGEICRHVRDALLEEPALASCSIRTRSPDRMATARASGTDLGGEIDIEVENGVVVLNGQVPSLSHKRLAGVLAWWVPGSRDVVNGLEEASPQLDNDGEVADAVRLVLEKDPFVRAEQIQVRVENYLVTLEGWAPNEIVKEIAEFDAWYVFGVDKVVNYLTVRKP
jgi:osmotically-inducible protein OsmY